MLIQIPRLSPILHLSQHGAYFTKESIGHFGAGFRFIGFVFIPVVAHVDGLTDVD